MANLIGTTTTLIDSAIGPLAVTLSQTDTSTYDIDDYVHAMVRSQAITLQLANAVSTVDPQFATNRFPVTIGGQSVGGF